MSYTNLINSMAATGIAEIITLPICTIKTNYQNSNSNSIIGSAKDIYAKHKLMGFYKASFSAISSQMISTSFKYTIYRHLEDNKYNNKVVNGIISGIMTSMITHPIDVIKIHRQMNASFISEFKKVGLPLFYRGYSKSLTKVMISSSLFFPLYDYFKEHTSGSLSASFLSATASTLIMSPVDYLKTRHIYNQPLYQGLNPVHYYKGLSINLLRIIPHFMITMTIIDLLNK